jgi:hypothetical protein
MKLDDLNHPLVFALAVVLVVMGALPLVQYFMHTNAPGFARLSLAIADVRIRDLCQGARPPRLADVALQKGRGFCKRRPM